MDKMRFWVSLCAFAFIVSFARQAYSAVVISNIELNATTLSLDLSGSIDVVGNESKNNLFIGQLSNHAWVNSFAIGVWTDGGGTHAFTTGGVNSVAQADFAYVGGNIDLVVGQTIEGSLTVTGSFNPASTDISQWVVSAGYNSSDSLPDPDTVTGAAAPEPTSGLLVLAGTVVLTGRRRR